jgi:hypothetical protein
MVISGMNKIRRPMTSEERQSKIAARLAHRLSKQSSGPRESRVDRKNLKRAERQAAGLCIYCDTPRLPDMAVCQRHYDSKRNRKQAKLTDQKCGNCTQSAVPGTTLCAEHTEIRRRKAEEWRNEKRSKGLCLICGDNPAVLKNGKFINCDDCRKFMTDRARTIRETRVANGECAVCGSKPILRNSRSCQRCYFKQLSVAHFGSTLEAEHLQQIFERQNCRCVYSGLVLTLSVNASLDHRIPITKDGPNTPDNVQWVHSMVNQMKWNYSEDAFLQMVRAIADHRR